MSCLMPFDFSAAAIPHTEPGRDRSSVIRIEFHR